MFLSQPGCDLGVRAKDGHTALMLAISQGSQSAVEQLVIYGAAIDAETDLGASALHFAIMGLNMVLAEDMQLFGAARHTHDLCTHSQNIDRVSTGKCQSYPTTLGLDAC